MRKLLLGCALLSLTSGALADTFHCAQRIFCNNNNVCEGIIANWFQSPYISDGNLPTGLSAILTSVVWTKPEQGSYQANSMKCLYINDSVSRPGKPGFTSRVGYPSYFPDFTSNTGWNKADWGKDTVICHAPNICQFTTVPPSRQIT